VTNNIFLNPGNEVINEKYDLKGSWVKRNSTPPQIGQRATCTHCNQKFVFSNSKKGTKKKGKKKGALSKEQEDEEDMNKCRMQVLGHHEPNVILKDNDLKYKLRLPNATSKHLITQLHKDSNFLCSLGVMDYSLLGKCYQHA
jgi:1-phosphatidylinositol-4-phosphate 5-kinase